MDFPTGKGIATFEVYVRVHTNQGETMEINHGIRLLAQILVYGATAVMVTKMFFQAVGVRSVSPLIVSRLHTSHPDCTGKEPE